MSTGEEARILAIKALGACDHALLEDDCACIVRSTDDHKE